MGTSGEAAAAAAIGSEGVAGAGGVCTKSLRDKCARVRGLKFLAAVIRLQAARALRKGLLSNNHLSINYVIHARDRCKCTRNEHTHDARRHSIYRSLARSTVHLNNI